MDNLKVLIYLFISWNLKDICDLEFVSIRVPAYKEIAVNNWRSNQLYKHLQTYNLFRWMLTFFCFVKSITIKDCTWNTWTYLFFSSISDFHQMRSRGVFFIWDYWRQNLLSFLNTRVQPVFVVQSSCFLSHNVYCFNMFMWLYVFPPSFAWPQVVSSF